MFVFGAVLLLMGSVLPALKISNARAGSLGAFPLAGILAATLFIGPILDTTGAKPALAAALAVIAGSLAVMPSLGSFTALAAAALAYGLGGGVLNTATNALISSISASGRGAALNLLGFSFSLGAILAPLLMSSLEGRSSAVLHVLAIACGVILILVLLLRFPAPGEGRTPLRNLLQVLNQPLVWLFGILLFFESGNENCMFVWAGKIVAEFLRTTPQRAALTLLGLSAALGVGRLLAILWLRWLGGRNVLLISAAVTVAGALVVRSQSHLAGMITGFAVIGLGMSAIYPTTLGIAGDRFPSKTGTVFGAIMAVSLIGGVAGPLLGGWAAGFGPLEVLWVPIVAGVGVAIFTVAVTKRG
ncbi:MAG TPA: MFS transporter [Terriglobia bacterium]|nr:MFS transporter [Terriglobia bacterium]